MRRVADVLTTSEDGVKEQQAGPPEQSELGRDQRLRRCLNALQQAAMANEAQQLVEFGMVVESGVDQLRVALGCLRSVLGNVQQHPDDEKLRRIRVNHPVIKVGD